MALHTISLAEHRLRILHVLATLDPESGGPAQACLEMAQSVADRGHHVSVFTTDYAGDGKDGETADLCRFRDLDVRVFPVNTPREWKRSVAMGRALRREVASFDVVDIHSLYLFHNWAAPKACYAAAVPYVIRPHGLLDPYIRRRHRWRKLVTELAFQNRALRRAAAIHYTAELEKEISTPYACGGNPVVIPLGVHIAAGISPPMPGALRHRFPQLTGKTVMLFLGRLHAKKGLDLLIPAFANARANHPELHLLLVGPDGGALAETKNLIAKAGLDRHVTIPGMLQGADKVAAFAESDFFVLPSYSENFAIAVAEAMAAYLPVIVSDQVNIHPDISAAQAGIVVNCSVDSLTKAINALASSSDRQTMGQRARSLVENKYSWPAVGRALEGLYQDIVARNPARRQ